MLKILGIIPARGGSKGVKNKNLKIINKKPLVYYTIKRAKQSKLITHLIGSTENKKIKKFFLNSEVSVPFNRPSNLATDKSEIVDMLVSITESSSRLLKPETDKRDVKFEPVIDLTLKFSLI